MGRSTEEGEDVGESWMNVFLGEVKPDLTISGQWAVASTGGSYCTSGAVGAECTLARGTIVLRIEWVDMADGSHVRLVLQEYTKLPNRSTGVGGFVTGIWVRPGDEALFDVAVD